MNKAIDTIKVEFIAPAHWYSRTLWRLLEDYTSDNSKVTVPAGFVTDGASIPWGLHWAFSPTGKYFGAAIVHDWIIAHEQNWGKANEEFEIEMKALAVESVCRTLIMWAVRAYRELFK